ncbi:MAG: flagellar basal-body rod protein FlgG [Planctomycetes bacterium]|nr:flagellar basal-body rod protein FlgG [Planctomycetota bacterium]MCB9871990.1 flagellar basal-body rod protein FlgG [Planctomycetota bacterium]MCB9888395.1 flagellar basal-body rod protein FlgG [Planctomycetota bacterium]
MLKSLYTTATGMKAQQTMVDTIAHNIANVNTAGFKKSQASFEDLLYVTLQAPGLNRDATGSPSPIGLQVGSGSRLSATAKIFTPGVLEGTGRNLDIAIDGSGFLQVQMPDGSTAFTRDGQLQINADGKLVTQAGLVIQPEITLPQDLLDVSIGTDGRVTGRTGGSPDTTTEFGQVLLVKFINPSGLFAEGGNVVRETAASGGQVQGTPGSAGFGSVRQAFIERSNVDIVNELVNLIVAQRAYEVNSKAIQASDQMLQIATNVLR